MQEYEKRVKSIIRANGGYREKEILKKGYTIERSETWNKEHKILNVISQEENDGNRKSVAIDIVTRSIVG